MNPIQSGLGLKSRIELDKFSSDFQQFRLKPFSRLIRIGLEFVRNEFLSEILVSVFFLIPTEELFTLSLKV